jgi:soluble lytic murein transglycosylase-like protein
MASINCIQALILMTIISLMGGCATVAPLEEEEPVAVPLTEQPTGNHLQSLASSAAYRYNIPPELFHALIEHESAWNPYAISRKGARGLTQIMPGTGKAQCGLEREVLFDPRLNLECGAYYFSKLLRRFGSVKLALAAYNSGENRVARLGRVPAIRETQRYVKRIIGSWQQGYLD